MSGKNQDFKKLTVDAESMTRTHYSILMNSYSKFRGISSLLNELSLHKTGSQRNYNLNNEHNTRTYQQTRKPVLPVRGLPLRNWWTSDLCSRPACEPAQTLESSLQALHTRTNFKSQSPQAWYDLVSYQEWSGIHQLHIEHVILKQNHALGQCSLINEYWSTKR
jgi:hypothetical protein